MQGPLIMRVKRVDIDGVPFQDGFVQCSEAARFTIDAYIRRR